MKTTNKPNLAFILFGSFLAAMFFFAATFTIINAFRQNDNVLGYYIAATVLQIVTIALTFLFMFFNGGLFDYWKQWERAKAKPTIFYPFIGTIFAGVACTFALISGFIDSGWAIAPGASIIINVGAYIMGIGFLVAILPSIIMIPMFFDRNKNINVKK